MYSGPDLPYNMEYHCVAKINESFAFVTGGKSSNAYYLNLDTDTWLAAPDMDVVRSVRHYPKLLENQALPLKPN